MKKIDPFNITLLNGNVILIIVKTLVFENETEEVYIHFIDDLNIDYKMYLTTQQVVDFYNQELETLKQSIQDYVRTVKG